VFADVAVFLLAVGEPCSQTVEEPINLGHAIIAQSITNPGEYNELCPSICRDRIAADYVLLVHYRCGMCLNEQNSE
jgi:hypothetical protein